MVKGLELFSEHFDSYEKHYVIIGGVACAIHEEINLQKARATKDIDLILVIEELNPKFAHHFWKFIREGGYKSKQKADNQRELYRFTHPTDTRYPAQIELFSKDVGFERYAPDIPTIPIPIDEDISSLSAILMDTDYYQFTLSHSSVVNGIHIANKEALICLKARAYNDLCGRKSQGEPIDSRNIRKHKNDIFRLGITFYESDRFVLPNSILQDWHIFLKKISNDLPTKDLFKSAGLEEINPKDVLRLLQQALIIQ